MESSNAILGRSVFFSCVVLVSFAASAAAADKDLLDLARAGHREACESIQTLAATVLMETVLPKRAPWMRCRYWRAAGRVRISNGDPRGPVEDYLMQGSEIRQVSRRAPDPSGRRVYAATRKAPGDFFCECDLDREMIFTVPGPGGGQYDFDQFLSFSKDPPQASRSNLDGHPCVRIKLAFDTTTGLQTKLVLWLDCERNYLIRKIEAAFGDDGSSGEVEILEFAEPVPGIYVPIQCRRRSFHGHKLQQERITTLEGLQVNQPIADAVFKLPAVPGGTILQDWIKGATYPISSDWRPIGPAKPLQKLISPGAAPSSEAEYRSPSTNEATPFSSWILPFSMILAVAAAAACVYRLWRRSSVQG